MQTSSQYKIISKYKTQKKKQITSSFRDCGQNKKCHCSLYMKMNSSYAFIDFCGDEKVYANKIELKYADDTTNQQARINCRTRIHEEALENGLDFWENVPSSFNEFKCAQIERDVDECVAYIVRAGNVTVQYDIDCGENWDEPLSKIEIKQVTKPADQIVLRGLCGTIEHKCPNFMYDMNTCVTNPVTLFNYWK